MFILQIVLEFNGNSKMWQSSFYDCLNPFPWSEFFHFGPHRYWFTYLSSYLTSAMHILITQRDCSVKKNRRNYKFKRKWNLFQKLKVLTRKQWIIFFNKKNLILSSNNAKGFTYYFTFLTQIIYYILISNLKLITTSFNNIH